VSETVKLPRTIRMDPSDTFVFATAAEPGEWAVSGTFLFHGRTIADLPRKEQTAFRAGFLGVASFGFSTLAVVSETQPGDVDEAAEALAGQFVARLGAPDIATALPAAREEVAFAASLCEGHPVNTLLALHRTAEDGKIRERFRTLKPRDQTSIGDDLLRGHDKAFFLVETDEPEDAGFEDHVDLVALMNKDRR
jgi:hypothetical protein